MPQETTSFDEAEAVPTLDPALEAIDQAAFALHFSSDPDASTEHRLDQLKQARDAFRRALDHLHRSPDVIKELPAWQVWHSEAEQELLQVCERLAELEADQTAGT